MQLRGLFIGIFFQLFDWNRSFAKKNLFSKKLLTPGQVQRDRETGILPAVRGIVPVFNGLLP